MLLGVAFARCWPGGLEGRIISISSGQSHGPMPGELAYIATKGAVEAFSLSLSAELGPLGITINAVYPGGTNTGWMGEDLRRELLARSPHVRPASRRARHGWWRSWRAALRRGSPGSSFAPVAACRDRCALVSATPWYVAMTGGTYVDGRRGLANTAGACNAGTARGGHPCDHPW